MQQMRPLSRVVAVLWVALVLAGCAGGDRGDPGYESSQEFPLPEGLQANVDFWRNVYGKWSRRQVAIHDDRHLALVYQILDLPGPLEESYTPAQRDYVRGSKESWSARLRVLERKVAERATLAPADRELLKQIETAAGRSALFGAADRVRSQRGLRERFRRGLEISGRYDSHFREVFRRHRLPEDLAYLPHVESSFQLNARSSAGASGVWQFMRSTGRQYLIVDSAVDQRLDPIVAADAAARYLKKSYTQLRSWPLALTSYNHGLGGMLRAQSQYGNDIARIVDRYDGRYFGFASRNFYAEFLAARHVARNTQSYFPEGVRYERAIDDQPVVLAYSATVYDLARQYGVSPMLLTSRNLAWLDGVRSGAKAVPAGTTVWVPKARARFASGEVRSSMR